MRGPEHLHPGLGGSQYDLGLCQEGVLGRVRTGVGGLDVDAEAAIEEAHRFACASQAVMTRDRDPGASLRGQHRRCHAHRAGAAEHHDLTAVQDRAVGLRQGLLHLGDHGGGRGVGPAGIRKHGNLERRHHGPASGIQHIGGEDRVAAADENAGSLRALGATRKNGVLGETGDVGEADSAIGNHRVPAGVVSHVHVEWADPGVRRGEMQQIGFFHGLHRYFVWGSRTGFSGVPGPAPCSPRCAYPRRDCGRRKP